MSSSAGANTASATKRLAQELKSYADDPNPALLSLGPVKDDDLMLWSAVMKGVEGTAYEGGTWRLTIQIPPTYPRSPPNVRFATPICHPNIHFQTGEICLDLLKTAWTPAYTISSTLTSVQQLLTSAEVDSPLNVDVAKLLREEDYVAAEGLVRFYTKEFRAVG